MLFYYCGGDHIVQYKKDNVIIGSNIKHYRKLNNLTQKQLGAKIGKTESSIQKYESGATEIPRSVLDTIASTLNLHILDLLDDGTAMGWLDERDEILFSLYKCLGCTIDFNSSGDEAIVTYKNNTYRLPASEIYGYLFGLIEDDVLDRLLTIIKPYKE